MTDEQQIAALQGEIRREGAGVARKRSRLRRVVWSLLGGDIVVMLGFLFVPLTGLDSLYLLSSMALVALFPLLVLALLLFPVPSILRRRALNRLRHRLAPLPRETLAEILVPLRHAPQWDARHLAASLAGQLGLPTELIPASARDTHGGEPSPAEETRGARLDR